MFFEPAPLPGFQRVKWLEGDKATQSPSLSSSRGALALPHAKQPQKASPVLTAVPAGALSSPRPGSLWVDGGTRATAELEAAGEGPSFS